MPGRSKNLTTGQVAEICGVSQRTIINWVKRGELPAFQLPGRGDRRITIKDLRKFLEQRKMSIGSLEEFLSQAGIVAPMSEPTSQQPKILVVDDDIPMAKAIARSLNLQGYTTEIANNGFDAGLMLADMRPSLITLDLQMPGIDGFQVLNKLKSNNYDIKVLVISAAPQELLQKALDTGADGALSKPFEDSTLHKWVDLLILKESNIHP